MATLNDVMPIRPIDLDATQGQLDALDGFLSRHALARQDLDIGANGGIVKKLFAPLVPEEARAFARVAGAMGTRPATLLRALARHAIRDYSEQVAVIPAAPPERITIEEYMAIVEVRGVGAWVGGVP